MFGSGGILPTPMPRPPSNGFETKSASEPSRVNLYPRSFLRLIVLGNILAVVPLLVAIGYAWFAIDDLSQRSDEAVRQASRTASIGYALDQELLQMERILRQYEVLGDPSLIEEYGVERQDWQRNTETLASIPLLTDLAARVREMTRAEAAAHEKLGPDVQGVAQLKTTLQSIRNSLPGVLGAANRLVEAEREAFRTKAEILRERLMIGLFAALALTMLVVLAGRRMVAILWARFENAVQALGDGRLEQRISLRGPADMEQAGSRLEWLRQRMVALEEDRNRIMRLASHELKTPLATLREGASLLSEGVAGPLTPQQAKIAGLMQTNAVRLQSFIDKFLRMQQASHARDHMETRPIRLDQVIEQTLTTHQLAARDRRLRISGALAPLTIQGGGEALATLADNLISNAIKFSPDGGLVRITLAREGENAVLDVIDEGPGISSEDRERIFEPFYRGTAGKGVAGVGLGLAIAHEFALAHQGSLEVIDSERGAHFRANFPMQEQRP
jgi:two-component system sensor histidine kinase GlrK